MNFILIYAYPYPILSYISVSIGNDFLPCLPHMDIADGSLNLMMNVYRDMLPDLGGYLTDKANIHLPRLELFIQVSRCVCLHRIRCIASYISVYMLMYIRIFMIISASYIPYTHTHHTLYIHA